MSSLLLLGILLAIIIFQRIFKYLIVRRKLLQIPGPKNFPFIGIVLERLRVKKEDLFNWFNALCYQFDSGIVLTWIGTQPVVNLRRPEQMMDVLRSNTQLTKSRMYELLRPLLRNGLATSGGELWVNHRRLITPSFHFAVLEKYAVIMLEKVEILEEYIESKLKSDPKAPLNIFHLIVKYSIDTACTAAMGINLDVQRKMNNDFVKALMTLDEPFINDRLCKPWLTWDFIYFRTKQGKRFLSAANTMHRLTEKLIQERQAIRKKSMSINKHSTHNCRENESPKRKAFLDILLDASENESNPLTLQELRDEVTTFIMASHDTTSPAIGWSLFALGNALEIQTKVHQELREVFGESKETATLDQMSKLKYLDRVIKEALRLYPSIPFVGRRLTEDFVVQNYRLPKGTIVNMSIYQLHHDPAVWEDPENFDPDRFLPENVRNRHVYSYLPFSAGMRNCVGQKYALLEMKIVLTAILRKWRVTSVLKPSEVRLQDTVLLKPPNGRIELYLTPVH